MCQETDKILNKLSELNTELNQLITERDTALFSLKKSEYRYKALSEAGVECIAIARDGVLLAVNKAFEKLLGYTEKELSQNNLMYRVILPEYREEVVRRIESKDMTPYRCVYQCKDGSNIRVFVRPKMVKFNGKGLCRAAVVSEWKECHGG